MYIKFGKYPPLLINKFSYTLETQLSCIPYVTILCIFSSVVEEMTKYMRYTLTTIIFILCL